MQSGKTPEVRDYFKDMETPNTEGMRLQLEQYVQQGILTPEDAETIMLEKSNMEGITLDPRMKQAQMDALSQLQEIGSEGGLTPMDKAKLARIASEEQTQSRGAREAILQNARERGIGGSGIELMSQMQNQQDSATRQSQRDLDVAGMAQQRALDAIMQAGQLGGQMGQQEFGQQAQVAGAQDAISRFNAQNQQNVINQNVQNRNAAQAANLTANQNIANQNTGQNNQQQQYNKQLEQQKFDNDLKKRQAQAGIAVSNAKNQGEDSRAGAGATNQTIGTGVTAIGMMMSDEREKKNIREVDPSEFLDKITGYSFEYKDKGHGDGKKMGVMAQDLEKTEAGRKMVVDGPDGKMVDYSQAGPEILASLANMNKRLRNIEGGGR